MNVWCKSAVCLFVDVCSSCKVWADRNLASQKVLACQVSEKGTVAYATVLFGADPEVVAQAVLLGHMLQTQSPNIDSVLLLVRQRKRGPQLQQLNREQRLALESVWSIVEVPDATVDATWLADSKDEKWNPGD